jgi:hypothetical protein
LDYINNRSSYCFDVHRLKFIVGSTQEKAEYKKSLVPIVVGVAILVFATTIVNVLFSLGGN